MKNKAFTLVELLAVLILISLIATLTIVSIDKKGNEYKNLSYSKFEKLLETSAYSYISSNNNLINSVKSGNIESVYFEKLIERKFLSNKTMINPKTNKEIDTKKSLIKINFQDNKYKYEIIIVDKNVK